MEEKGYKIFGILIAIFAIVIFIFAMINHLAIETKITEQISIYGLTTLFIISFFLEFIPQYISPHITIFSAALLKLNLINAFFAIAIGSSLGSFLGFEVGKRIKHRTNFTESLFGKKIGKKLEKGLNNKGKFIISLTAVTPLPYIPMIWGVLNVSRKNFLIYGIIPRVIGLLIISLISYGII